MWDFRKVKIEKGMIIIIYNRLLQYTLLLPICSAVTSFNYSKYFVRFMEMTTDQTITSSYW
jgi:hypothetical protein